MQESIFLDLNFTHKEMHIIVRLKSDMTLPEPKTSASRGIVFRRDSAQHWDSPWQAQDVVKEIR